MWIRKIKRAFFRLYGKRFLLHASPFFVDNDAIFSKNALKTQVIAAYFVRIFHVKTDFMNILFNLYYLFALAPHMQAPRTLDL